MGERIVSFKDLTCRKDISVRGTGKFFIGLTVDGSLAVEAVKDAIGVVLFLLEVQGRLTVDGSLAVEAIEDSIVVVLFLLEVQGNGGCTLCGASRDLKCVVNSSEELAGEIHLINGTRLEIADKVLVFIDGPIPKLRRKLPRTPGMALVTDAPPAKPARNSSDMQDTVSEGPADTSFTSLTSSVDPAMDQADPGVSDPGNPVQHEDRRWLESSWCMLDLPVPDQEMFAGLDTPEKVGILSASYLCKQVRVFTDATVSSRRLDDIFKMCLDSVDQCRDIYMDYLADISRLLARIPDHSNTQPMHGPAIKFLAQLLTNSLDPVSRVVLILDLLRTFSHFEVNLPVMVRYQTAAAVMGSMTVFLDVVEVQQFSMDILSKIALYRPRLDRKEPVRDVGIDLVVRGMKHHTKNLALARAGCRVLANLSATLLTVTNQCLDTAVIDDRELLVSAVDRYETLLLYVFEHGIPAVQCALREFRSDLGVSTEGRRFIFYYAKLPQLQMKKSKWVKEQTSSPVPDQNDQIDAPSETELDSSNQHELEESCDPSVDQSKFLRKESIPEAEVVGILKNRQGSYENRRVGIKRIVFADDTVGGSDSDSFTSESDSELARSLEASVELDKRTEEKFSIQVRHVMKRTIKRQKSFRDGEVKSDTEEDSFTEESVLEDTENHEASRSEQCENDDDDGYDDDGGKEDNGETADASEDKSDINERVVAIQITDSGGDPSQIPRDNIENKALLDSDPITEQKANTDNDNDKKSVYRTVSIDQDFVLIEESQEEKTTANTPFKHPANDTKPEFDNNDTMPDSDNNTLPESVTNTLPESNTDEVTCNVTSLVLDSGKVCQETTSTSLPESSEKTEETGNVQELPENITTATEAEVASSQDGGSRVAGTKGAAQKDDVVIDVYFYGKLVRTQIIVYVGTLVFQGEDSKVLLIIDQPLRPLLEEAGAPQELLEFAGSQYGATMTLMDLEPAIVINIIDAVRYRSVTTDLVQSAMLGLTRTISASLQQDTINTTMRFIKAVFANTYLQSVLSGEEFLKEFRTCFQNATQRLEKSHTLEEIRQGIAEKSYVV